MPFLETNDTTIHYQYDDFGHNETIVFSNSLGTDFSMWGGVVSVVKNQFNVLRYDTRGHGQSLYLPPDGVAFLVADLGKDVISLIGHLGFEKVHFCGLSMGGLIGQWLGINAPDRFHSITLANTAAKIGNDEGWNARIKMVLNEGFESLANATEGRWFTDNFRKSNPEAVTNIIGKFKKNIREGYCANCAAIRDADFREKLHLLKVPTLVISGSQDAVTTVVEAEFLTKNIPVARHITLEAAHLSAVEQYQQFTDAIIK